MRRHAHHDAGTVMREDIVGDPQRNLLAIQRIRNIAARENTVFLAFHCSLTLGLLAGLADVLLYRVVRDFRRKGMFRRNHDERHTEYGVRACCEDGHAAAFKVEIDLAADGASDPVALECLGGVRPAVKFVDVVKQPRGHGRILEEPAVLDRLLDNFGIAAPAAAIVHLLVGEDSVVLAPVDGARRAVSPSILEEQQEQPLGPLVVVRLEGTDFAIPVVGDSHALERRLAGLDVLQRPVPRMQLVLDGRVFSGQTECIPPERMEDVISPHHAISRKGIANTVVTEVTHMNVARRVGEHLEDVVFAVRCRGRGVESCRLPPTLPLGLNRLGVVFHRMKILAGPKQTKLAADWAKP